MANFEQIIKRLKSFYGKPQAPKIVDPFQLILWENVAYLVEDTKREKIFAELKQRVGLGPVDIFNASLSSRA